MYLLDKIQLINLKQTNLYLSSYNLGKSQLLYHTGDIDQALSSLPPSLCTI